MEKNTSGIIVDGGTEEPWYTAASTVAMVMVALLTLTGNIFVISAIFMNKPLRIVPNFFIVSLAVADMMVAVLVMPFHISTNVSGEWIYGEVLCKIWLTCDVFLCTASILNLCIIALDRYWAIHDPLNYARKRTIKRVLIMIALSWILSGIISIPPVFGWGNSGSDNLYNDDIKSCTLSSDKGYVLYSACGSFYIPLVVMSFVYIKIFLATKRRLQKRAKAAQKTKMAMMNSSNFKTSSKKKTRNNSDSTNEDGREDSTNSGENRADSSENMLERNGKHKKNSEMNGNLLTSNTNTIEADIKSEISYGVSRDEHVKNELHHKSRCTRQRSSIHNFFEEKQRISLSKERRAARTLAIIMITFVICWIPFFLMYLILPFCDSCSHPGVAVEVLFVWLGYINSTLNPIIYTVFNMEFRKAFNDIIAKCCCASHYRRTLTRSFV